MLARLETALGQTPWDDDLRLVYADCLDDHGQAEAAEAQRVRAARKRRKGKSCRSRDRKCYDNTGDSAIFRKLHKRRFAGCDRCPWHSGENAGRKPAHTSWKKNKTKQWRSE